MNFSNMWRDVSRLKMLEFGIQKLEKECAVTCLHATKHNCERRRGVKSDAEVALDAWVVQAADVAFTLRALSLEGMFEG